MSTNNSNEITGGTPNAFRLELMNTDIWVNCIFRFLGPGHYLYVALVSHRFKKMYKSSVNAIKEPPMLRSPKIRAAATNTCYSMAFSSVPCAEYWDKVTKEDSKRLDKDSVCQTIARRGDLQVLKWAHKKGYPWHEWTCAFAAEQGRLEMLIYAKEKGCPWNLYTCAGAAKNGHLEVLKYAHEHGCPCDENTCHNAARNGHLEVLKYAHDHGCPWDKYTCASAAQSGQLELLKYAHEMNCPWDEDTCRLAVQNGYREVAEWAHEHGCPWDRNS